MKLNEVMLKRRKESLLDKLRKELAALQDHERDIAERKRECLDEILLTRRVMHTLGGE